MNKFRDWVTRMMQGRYGADQLTRTMVYAVFVIMILSLFIRSGFLNLLAIVLLGYSYFRMMSKNHSARYQENEKFLKATAGIRSKVSGFISSTKQRKDYHIYTCPNKECRQKIRVPRGKGHIQITCPKCHTQFIKNS